MAFHFSAEVALVPCLHLDHVLERLDELGVACGECERRRLLVLEDVS
jgi:hypothetical protein